MKYEIVKDVDQFNEKTTIKMNRDYFLSYGVIEVARLSIRYLSMPDIDSFFIDYQRTGSGDIRPEGDMIIRVNDTMNIKLPFIDCEFHYLGTEFNRWNEYTYVKLDKPSLEKICEASDVEIKISGNNPRVYNKSQCREFIKYCKIFYNGFYKEQKYVIENALLNNQELIKREQEKTPVNDGVIVLIIGAVIAIILVLAVLARL